MKCDLERARRMGVRGGWFAAILLCVALALCACGKDAEGGKASERKGSGTPGAEAATPTQEVTQPEGTPTLEVKQPEGTPTPGAEKSVSFAAVVADTERMIEEAVEQFEKGDYTRLNEPVQYHVLWLGFTHVTFGELDFRIKMNPRKWTRHLPI